MTTASPSDWAAFLFLGTGVWAAGSLLVLLMADAELRDFDPRRLLETDAGARLLVEITRAKATVRDAALTVAVLLTLLIPNTEESR